MDYLVSAAVVAAPERVWAVMVDVESMPTWSRYVSSVHRLEQAPFGVGSTARVTQPRLRPTVWRVTELTPERSFWWTSRTGGVSTEAGHELSPGPDGSSVVTLTVRQRGLLAPVVGRLLGSLLRRYVDAELAGLKLRAEAG